MCGYNENGVAAGIGALTVRNDFTPARIIWTGTARRFEGKEVFPLPVYVVKSFSRFNSGKTVRTVLDAELKMGNRKKES